MIRALLFSLLLAAAGAGALRAEEGEAPESRSGALLEMGLTQYVFQNGSPLAYRFGGGYQFPGGLRLTTALDTLYYAGDENGVRYSYQLNNWLVQALYEIPLRWHLRAQGGANVDFLFGSRGRENLPGNPEGISGFIGLGILGGLALDLTEHWGLALQGRWTETFTPFPSFPAIDLTAVYTW